MALRLVYRAIVTAVIGLATVYSTAHADSLLEGHFGVTPTLGDTIGGAYYADALNLTSLTPTRNVGTVDYCISDWYGSWSPCNFNVMTLRGDAPSGGEPYDIEAMYFDNDSSHLYFAVVTSVAPGGALEARNGEFIVSGDFAIDTGLNADNADGFSYDHGVNVTGETRTTGDAVLNGAAIDTGVYQTANGDWYLGSPSSAVDGQGELTNFDPNWSGFAGQLIGDAIVNYYQLFDGGDNGTATYVLEITIDRSAFPWLGDGDTVGFGFMPGCRNDVMQCSGDVDSAPVPEPATVLLLAGAVAGLGLRRRRQAA